MVMRFAAAETSVPPRLARPCPSAERAASAAMHSAAANATLWNVLRVVITIPFCWQAASSANIAANPPGRHLQPTFAFAARGLYSRRRFGLILSDFPMKVLVVGNGGREHALAWKIAQSPRVDRVFIAPGNAGTAVEAENVPLGSEDISGLVKFVKENGIELTVVGPEAPLVAGIVDVFQREKLRVFGPSKAAAQLEGSKVFCKNVLHGADVPAPDYRVFRDADSAT